VDWVQPGCTSLLNPPLNHFIQQSLRSLLYPWGGEEEGEEENKRERKNLPSSPKHGVPENVYLVLKTVW
jgi:hypothetical protein